MFVFEDIITMDDRSVQRFVRDCDPRDLVLDSKMTNEEVSRKLLANMSTRIAQNIKDNLEITTNARLKDVEDSGVTLERQMDHSVDNLRDLVMAVAEKAICVSLKSSNDVIAHMI